MKITIPFQDKALSDCMKITILIQGNALSDCMKITIPFQDKAMPCLYQIPKWEIQNII
jgi:hypothetical protein